LLRNVLPASRYTSIFCADRGATKVGKSKQIRNLQKGEKKNKVYRLANFAPQSDEAVTREDELEE
jgi:hypothetical protein